MITRIILILFLFSGFASYGQILNIESERQEADTSKRFIGSLELGLQVNNRSITEEDENTFLQLSLEANTGYQSKKHIYMMLNDFDYITFNNENSIRTGYNHFRANFLHLNPTSYESYGQVQYDLGRGLELRWLVGGGIRQRLYNEKWLKAYFGISAMYESEKWTFAGIEGARQRRIPKVSAYLSTNFTLSENASLGLVSYYQTGYDHVDEFYRHRFAADIELELKITKVINFITHFNYFYESDPIVPIRNYFYTLENGIEINF